MPWKAVVLSGVRRLDPEETFNQHFREGTNMTERRYAVDLSTGEVSEAPRSGAVDLGALHGVVAQWTGAEEDPAVVNLSEKPEDSTGGDLAGGSYFGVDELLKIAAQDDGAASEEQQFHDALRAQESADRFGEDDPSISDEAMWTALSQTWGLEEEEK